MRRARTCLRATSRAMMRRARAASPLTPARVRALPAVSDERLSQGFAFFENAGSQAPAFVADAIHEHVLHGFAQLGAGYPQSARADAMADAAHAVAKAMAGVVPERLGGTGGDVAIGSSARSCWRIWRAVRRLVGPGDEIVVQPRVARGQRRALGASREEDGVYARVVAGRGRHRGRR